MSNDKQSQINFILQITLILFAGSFDASLFQIEVSYTQREGEKELGLKYTVFLLVFYKQLAT